MVSSISLSDEKGEQKLTQMYCTHKNACLHGCATLIQDLALKGLLTFVPQIVHINAFKLHGPLNCFCCLAEAFLTRCDGELSFGHSGAAVMAVGCSASNVYSASCAGILVGGSHGRPDMWLLGVQTILQVLDTVRFLPNMSLAQPDEDMVRKAEQEYGFFCMEIPEKEQLSLQPYSETSKHMTPAIVELTAVMIGEFDADRVIKRRNKESIRKIGSRSSVKAAIQAYSNQPKVQDKIEDTTRFDYGESQGNDPAQTSILLFPSLF